jgi:hypothetical protein
MFPNTCTTLFCMWLQNYYIYSPIEYMLNSFMTSKWTKSEGAIKNEKKNELTCKIGQMTQNDDKQNKRHTED